jgi:hypothetical protein
MTWRLVLGGFVVLVLLAGVQRETAPSPQGTVEAAPRQVRLCSACSPRRQRCSYSVAPLARSLAHSS